MSAAAARAGRDPPARRPTSTLAVPAARALAFIALCGFAALQWMQMLEPAAGQRAGYAVLAASAAICGLLVAGRLPGRARTAAAVLVASGRSRSRCWPAASPTSSCCPATGASWRPASAAASTRCPARASPTAAWTSGRAW